MKPLICAPGSRIRWTGMILYLSLLGCHQAPIDVSLFRNSVRRFQASYGRDITYTRYDPSQIHEIGANILAFQNVDGGWPKNIDWLARLEPEEIRRLMGPDRLTYSTLDNRSTYAQVDWLAHAYARTGATRYRESCLRGLEYIFREQRPSGGWRGADVEAITFNDDVMSGVMHLLLDIRQDQSQWDWLGDSYRRRVDQAFGAALDVILRCQVQVDGVKTVWAQQHDHETLEPIGARSFELPGLCSAESVSVIKMLMRIDDPEQRIVEAIESAIAWFERSRITGLRIERVPIDPVRYPYHTADYDLVVVQDHHAGPLWARFYEVKTNQPFFTNSDGRKVSSLAELHPERRTGYGWYVQLPRRLLDVHYPAWKKRIERR